MNTKARTELVKAMNEIILSLNDEDFCGRWFMLGVADGDTTLADMESYTDDKTFSELMYIFADIMHDATQDGPRAVLYCDGVAGGTVDPSPTPYDNY